MVLTKNRHKLDDKAFEAFIQGAQYAPYIALDTESNGQDLRDGAGQTLGMSISYQLGEMEPIAEYFPFRHIDWNYDYETFNRLFPSILDYHRDNGHIIFHNAKHDLVALESLGYHYTGKFYDTMLMAHYLNENYQSKSLDWLSRIILDDHKDRSEQMDHFIKGFGWAMVPADLIYEYAAHDAYLTLKLFNHFKPQWDAENLEPFWEYEQKFIRTIIEMERRGILIDPEFIQKEITTAKSIMAVITKCVGYNLDSPKELRELFFDVMKLEPVEVTAKGEPSLNKTAMEKYDEQLKESKNPLANQILEYRGWATAVRLAYQPYLKLVSKQDGRLHPNYKLHGTVTGRLSCENPNLQQIPRVSDKPWNGGLKRAFIPAEGYKLWDADYSQLEFRLGAAYAEEKALLKIFNEDRDIFTEMSKTLGLSRYDTKTLVYTIQFGGGVDRISKVFNVDMERAARIRDTFYRNYPGLKEIAARAGSIAKKQGKIKIWSGRYRHFANPREEYYKAFNSVIQGGACDIVKRSILRVNDALTNPDEARLLLTVHDSVVVEILEGREDYWLPIIKEQMEAVTPDFGVKFKVEVKEWGK